MPQEKGGSMRILVSVVVLAMMEGVAQAQVGDDVGVRNEGVGMQKAESRRLTALNR